MTRTVTVIVPVSRAFRAGPGSRAHHWHPPTRSRTWTPTQYLKLPEANPCRANFSSPLCRAGPYNRTPAGNAQWRRPAPESQPIRVSTRQPAGQPPPRELVQAPHRWIERALRLLRVGNRCASNHPSRLGGTRIPRDLTSLRVARPHVGQAQPPVRLACGGGGGGSGGASKGSGRRQAPGPRSILRDGLGANSAKNRCRVNGPPSCLAHTRARARADPRATRVRKLAKTNTQGPRPRPTPERVRRLLRAGNRRRPVGPHRDMSPISRDPGISRERDSSESQGPRPSLLRPGVRSSRRSPESPSRAMPPQAAIRPGALLPAQASPRPPATQAGCASSVAGPPPVGRGPGPPCIAPAAPLRQQQDSDWVPSDVVGSLLRVGPAVLLARRL